MLGMTPDLKGCSVLDTQQMTLYDVDYEKWVSLLLSAECEMLTFGMKVFALKWHEINRALARKGQVDTLGYTRISYGYLAKCLGCSLSTVKRLVKDMHTVGYIDKRTTQVGNEHKEIVICVLNTIWNVQLTSLPKTNKGKGQKKFICTSCGSHDVDVEIVGHKIQCYECGTVTFIDHKGHERYTQPWGK